MGVSLDWIVNIAYIIFAVGIIAIGAVAIKLSHDRCREVFEHERNKQDVNFSNVSTSAGGFIPTTKPPVGSVAVGTFDADRLIFKENSPRDESLCKNTTIRSI